MLIDSYDATGIKFGILMTDGFLTDYYDYVFKGEDLDKINEAANELILNNKAIIDFNEFDGLTTEEVYKIMKYSHNTPLIFVVYSGFETIDSLNQRNVCNGILYKYIIRGVKYKDSLIDEDIEEIMVKNYQSYDRNEKRLVNCFLQRYRYGTKEKTDEAIKRYIKK